jgi:hypothetical protein
VDRYSFLVRHFHPQFHAGLARRTTHFLFLMLTAYLTYRHGAFGFLAIHWLVFDPARGRLKMEEI